jgi:hypothetical protein
MVVRVELELYKLSIIERKETSVKVEKIEIKEVEKIKVGNEILRKIELIENSNLNEADAKFINTKIVNFQLNLLKNTTK